MKKIIILLALVFILQLYSAGCSKKETGLQFRKHVVAEEDGYMVEPSSKKMKKNQKLPRN